MPSSKRWTIEETIRYIKTCYDLENVRVLNYQGLQNLMPLLLAVMYFWACVLNTDAHLRVMAGYVERTAKLLFGIPDFTHFSLTDGLRAIFIRHAGSPSTRLRDPAPTVPPICVQRHISTRSVKFMGDFLPIYC